MNRNGHESIVWAPVRSKIVGALGLFPQLSLTGNTVKRLFPLVLMCANSWFIEAGTAQPSDARANGQNSPQNSRAITPVIVKLPADSKFLEVAKFYGSHLIDVPPSEPPGQARVIWQAFRQNKIWLQLLYSPLPEGLGGVTPLGAMYVVDPTTGQSETIPLPTDGNFQTFWTDTPNSFEVMGDQLYLGSGGTLRKYNLRTKVWDAVPVMVQEPVRVRSINNRLYVTTSESILELSEKQDEARILASRRRRPAASPLDELEGLNLVPLFPGPAGALRTFVEGRIFIWSGTSWAENFSVAPKATPSVYNDGVLFVVRHPYQMNKLWRLGAQSQMAELAISELPIPQGGGMPRLLRPEEPSIRSVWKSPVDLNVTASVAAVSGSNVLFYVENTVSPPNWQELFKTHNTDGRDATLLVCDQEFTAPILVPLKFSGRKPADKPIQASISAPSAKIWLLPTPAGLAIGTLEVDGFWFVPQGQLDAELDRRRKILRTTPGAVDQASPQQQKRLVDAYDKNRNGVLDPQEKLAMIIDPAYLRQNWPSIDTNQNQILDVDDLLFFDMDGDGKAAHEEIDAIGLMQDFVAADLFLKFDRNKDGGLDAEEMRAMTASIQKSALDWAGARVEFSVSLQFDVNHDGKLNQVEFKEMLKSRLMARLFAGMHMSQSAELRSLQLRNPMTRYSPATAEGRAACRVALEALWAYRRQGLSASDRPRQPASILR